MVEVEIIGQVITAQFGTLNTGDILRTSEEFAKHLVEDCRAAKYLTSEDNEALSEQDFDAPSAAHSAAEPAAVVVRRRRAKQ